MVDQAGQVSSLSLALPDGVLEGVQGEVGVQGAGDPPADDAPGEQVHDERDVDEPGPGRDVGDVSDPAVVRCRGGEVPVQLVGRVSVLGRDRRAGSLVVAGDRADQAQHLHPARHGAPRHRWVAPPGGPAVLVQNLLAVEHLPHLHHPIDLVVVVVGALDALIKRRVG